MKQQLSCVLVCPFSLPLPLLGLWEMEKDQNILSWGKYSEARESQRLNVICGSCLIDISLVALFYSFLALLFHPTMISFYVAVVKKKIVVYWEELIRKKLLSFLKDYQAGYFGYIFSYKREQKESTCSFILCVCFCIQLWCLKWFADLYLAFLFFSEVDHLFVY